MPEGERPWRGSNPPTHTPAVFPITLIRPSIVFGETGAAHECQRPCVVGDTRTCHYDFRVQEYFTLSRACYDCPDNLEDCSREECIAADGVSIPLLAVNRQLPGPSIQVCEGDRVVVDLHNTQLSDTETIHFHGQTMKGHQYYDGVPYLTQCPVMGATFRYDFIPTTSGTHLWHSHVGLHRSSGVFGPLVVRQAEDPHRGLYDTDLPEHVIMTSGWNHDTMNTLFWASHHAGLLNYPKNILINGKGRNPFTTVKLPLAVVGVTAGLKHRLRFVDGGSFDCPMLVSVDGHRLTLIAIDGTPIMPFTTDSFIMLSGERYDVVLEADQPVDNYWIRINGLGLCSVTEARQGAILRYEGAPEQDPTAGLLYQPGPQGVLVNPIKPDPDAPNFINLATLTALQPSRLHEKVDKQFYLAFNFRTVNDTRFYNPRLYPFNKVSGKFQTPTPQVNGITFTYPTSPPLSQPHAPQPSVCLYGERPQCDGDFCSCTYVVEVELGDTVEFVLIDEGDFLNSSHPFHLHGNNFHVVAMERLGDKTSLAEVVALDVAGHIKRRLTDTIKKDTVNIPHGGYTVIRFTASNPGWWAMHCHLVDHSEMGMVGAVHVGRPEDLPPIPEGFPTCGSFVPDI